LHPVKNYAFLVQACCQLREMGVRFRCVIVGDGPERQKLARLIRQLGIDDAVALAGHVSHSKIGAYYELADLFVLTSRSEGIPLVLMEAMAQAIVVLAPAITGIPELVIDGGTGYLFRAGDLEEFVWRVQQILSALDKLGPVREAARAHVRENFERKANLEKFADTFLQKIAGNESGCDHEDFVLQQI
jgi:glycosyltransferase involved in cell wall biosynthesis